jgi:hypothetical protein
MGVSNMTNLLPANNCGTKKRDHDKIHPLGLRVIVYESWFTEAEVNHPLAIGIGWNWGLSYPICSMVLEYLPTFAQTKSPSFGR